MNKGQAPTQCGKVPAISAVAVVYPVVDAVGFNKASDPLMGVAARSMTEGYLGGSPEEYPQRYVSVSSSSTITAAAPPTLVVASPNDHLVPAGFTYSFVAQARAAGVDVTLERVPFADHLFDSTPIGAQLYRNITGDWLDHQLGH